MQVDILGPLRVRVEGQDTDLGGPRNRALIARLALDAGRPVRAATLIDDLWGMDVPADAANALQSIVSRTRRRLPADTLASTPAGYVLLLAETDVDSHEFERLADEGQASKALALWRGPALADLRDVPFVEGAVVRFESRRLAVLEQHLGETTRNGADGAMVAELAELTAANPYRDGLWILYLRALVDTGRPAEALAAYEGMRKALADDLGADPSAELQELHLAILSGETGSGRRRRAPLPSSLTTFVGRAEALVDLEAAIAQYRLVTVLGPGGAGKTRLAIEAARRIEKDFDDVWLVELASVTVPEDVMPAILTAMGLLEVAVFETGPMRSDERDRLVEALRDRAGLIILDNCEHLIDSVARIAEDLLTQSASLTVLATSREPLRIFGEYAYQLVSLTTPPAGACVAVAAGFGAIELFVQRARTVDLSFELTEDNLPWVVEICSRLDGQPLAIELAAARLRTLTVEQVASRLSDRFRLLTGGSRTSLPRHRTLRAVVEWSWDLLEKDECELAARIAVFPGGVTAESAACVSGTDTAELLDSLVDKSLLVPVRGVTPRFRMLETIREFGVERLIENGTVQQVRSAHLGYFLEFVQTRAPALRGPGQLEVFGDFDAERGNINAALRFAVDQQDRDRAARLVAWLAWYWAIRDQHVESTTWASAVLELPGRAIPEAEVCCLGLAVIGCHMDDSDANLATLVDQILDIYDTNDLDDPLVDMILAAIDFYDAAGGRTFPEAEDPWARAAINLMRIMLLDNDGRAQESVRLLNPTISLFREVGDRWGLASALSQKALVLAMDGNFDEATTVWGEALPLLSALGAEEDVAFIEMKIMTFRLSQTGIDDIDSLRAEMLRRVEQARDHGSRRVEFISLMNLGLLEHIAGNDDESLRYLRRVRTSLDRQGGFDGGQMEASLLANIAIGEVTLGDLDAAAIALADAARVSIATRDMPIVSQVAVAAAWVTDAAGDSENAARRLGAAIAIRGMSDQMDRGAKILTDKLRQDLGSDMFESLLAEGRSLDRAAAIELALADFGGSSSG